MTDDAILVSVTNNGKQLINSPDEALNRLCWTPEGFASGSVFIFEGTKEALEVARNILFNALVEYGNFHRPTKVINETALIDSGYEPGIRDNLGINEDIAYRKQTILQTIIPNFYKSIIENVTRVVDYVIISPIAYVRTEDVQHIRYIHESRNSLASTFLFVESVPDGAGEIADGYAAVKLINGALWFDRGFEEARFINYYG